VVGIFPNEAAIPRPTEHRDTDLQIGTARR
jgi:hypothetical protein